MVNRVKLIVSVDRTLADKLNDAAARKGKSRGKLAEEALKQWLRDQQAAELAEGYRAMAEEDRETAEKNLKAAIEVWG